MNHQPFEDWLLNDKKLTGEEKREMDAHLRNCSSCAALSETGFALHAARVVSPAPGFVSRFTARLAAQKIAERRRRLWGLFLLILTGAGLFAWLAAPYIYAFAVSPVEWIVAGIGYFLFAMTSIVALFEALAVLLSVIPNLIPPYIWMVLVSATAGAGLLWTVSIWQFSKAPQGVAV
jgi:hypothetical protein